MEEINQEQKDFLVKFMHPHGPIKSFKWPTRDDQCWVSFDKFICKIDTPKTATGRMYQISDSDYEKILNLEHEIGTH